MPKFYTKDIPDFDKEPEFMTYSCRNNGDLAFCKDRDSLRRQLHANRRKRFECWTRTPGTMDYTLTFVLDREYPLPGYRELDSLIEELLA